MRDAERSEREWTQIVRGEFLQIPGLRLTRDQIQQFWGMSSETCAMVLETLLSQRFLQLTSDDHYVHGSPDAAPRHYGPQGESFQRVMAFSAR
jgi:hypothetical protein